MTSISPITRQDDPAKLPHALRPLIERAQWCVWRRLMGEDGEWRPAPCMATAPDCPASADYPATWCDYETASAALEAGGIDGLSFVLTPSDPFIVMELGNCRHPRTGSVDIWAQNYLDVTRATYAEATPSGDGCRIWGLTADGTDPIDRKFALEIDGKAITVELFRRGPKILTVTGLRLTDVRWLANIDRGLEWALAWRDRRTAQAIEDAIPSMPEPETQAETASPEPAPQAETASPEPAPQAETASPEPAPQAETASPDPAPQAETALPPKVTLTRLTKNGGPLTKQISLAADGSLLSDGSACVMAHGSAMRVEVTGVAGLGALIETLTASQALALGSLRADLPDEVEIATRKSLQGGASQPGVVARTGGSIIYHGPAFLLLDYDTKGMPGSVAAELKRAGGFWPGLKTVLPALDRLARLTRSSTSAGLWRTDTGGPIPGSDGVHIYITVKDGGDAERFLRTLHERCWLAGLGWMMVGRSGALLERSIVDRMVGGPERLVFEGGPVLLPPLQQDPACRRPIAIEGGSLDTLAACLPLTIVERARLDELKAKERERLAPEAAKARDRFVLDEANRLIATGISASAARAAVRRWSEGVLRPDIVLPFDDPALAACTVGDVLDDPERFEGETLADPIEGVSYGRCCAKVMRRADGVPWIHSFAHGRTIYQLKHDASSVREAMEKAAKEDVVATFARLAANADLDPVETEGLRHLAKDHSGVGLSVIKATLKSAQQQQDLANAKAARSFRAARRQDPRVRIQAPLPDEPWLPPIEILNEVVGAVAAVRPPSRDIDDDAMRVRKIPINNMHAFTPSAANAKTEENDE